MTDDPIRDALVTALIAWWADEAGEPVDDLPEATESAALYADALLPVVRGLIADELDGLAEKLRGLADGPVPAIDSAFDALEHAHDGTWTAHMDRPRPRPRRPPQNGDPVSTCPHCPDQHRAPESRPWGAYVASERDGDGQPTHLRVLPTNGAHVAESDAEWVRQWLNAPGRIVQAGSMRGCVQVAGKCPACGTASLALGEGGYVTCASLTCREPDAASRALEAL